MKNNPRHPGNTCVFRWLLLVGLLGWLSAIAMPGLAKEKTNMNTPILAPCGLSDPSCSTIFLPLVTRNYPWVSPFGAEVSVSINSGEILSRTTALPLGWVRLTDRPQWNVLQPTEGGPILWDTMANFEAELRTLQAAGIRPVVTVDAYPHWATITYSDWPPSSCGAIRTDKFTDYAEFMRQLVAHYKAPEFNVHNWELGNEPDVDPHLVEVDNGYGCWGDRADVFYGGRHYGEMLKVVVPVMRAEDPGIHIWIGGLLLDRPDTSISPNYPGRPELFLQGILEAGAAPYFDIVPYHYYPPYLNLRLDYDVDLQRWKDWGGGVVGKATFLRNLMSQYSVTKPVVLDETGLMCADVVGGVPVPYCSPPSDAFFQAQADFLVRSFVRGWSQNVQGFAWYTLNPNNWRYTALLDSGGNAKPVYSAYQELVHQLTRVDYSRPLNYGDSLEAYAFQRGAEEVDVIWARSDVTATVAISTTQFAGAFGRDGEVLPTVVQTLTTQFEVGFEPVYLIVTPP